MVERSGFRSVPLTNGSASERPNDLRGSCGSGSGTLIFDVFITPTIITSFDVFFRQSGDGLSLYSQVHQAADRKDADEEAGQLTHSGSRQEEAQGDTGQAQGKPKP
jgi:hypothetical protein